ncbi:ferrous iron transport protein A [Methanosarcina sp. DH2]|jgi:ferrous iron transport protein A|uniref:FeoA family protein n=1 Tax=Methanosarcina sp. DH2 TaxID=2605639 RepID=UPI001E46E2C2|nr:FeoA family protein [Methanosarcina sp. DH2]MCC4769769.1 ferrous iron transport protein A [Methanosarcina sp. DH2]
MIAENSHISLNTTLKTTTLSSMEPRKTGKISSLETKNAGILQKLIAMGILPGMPVTLLRRSPSYLFEVDQTRYAVDREVANHIYVSY